MGIIHLLCVTLIHLANLEHSVKVNLPSSPVIWEKTCGTARNSWESFLCELLWGCRATGAMSGGLNGHNFPPDCRGTR